MWCIIICLVLGLVFLVYYLRTRHYEEEFITDLDEKEHSLRFLYPMSLHLLFETPLQQLMQKKEQQKENLCALYIGEDKEIVQILYWCKKIATMLLIFVVCILFAFVMEVSSSSKKVLQQGNYLVRQEGGQGEGQVSIVVSGEGKKEQTISVEIPEKQYTKKELAKKMKEAKQYISEHYLGENESKEQVWKSLNFMDSIPNSAILVSWSVSDNTYLNMDGTLENDLVPEEGVDCLVYAKLTYLEEKEEMEFLVHIVPKKELSDSDWKDAVSKAISEEAKKEETKKKFKLPTKVLNEEVTYSEPKESGGSMFLMLGFVGVVILWIFYDQDLNKKMKEHDTQMLVDYPELINKFVLLLSAGMTVNGAWGKIAKEYQNKISENKCEKRFAYEEWAVTWNEMNNGVTETKALEHFGQRSKLLPYMKFSSLLAQNLRKGSKGLLELLEYEAMDAFENRKQMTRRLAEEAGTKLLGPMMAMLFLVLIIIMVPAMTSM